MMISTFGYKKFISKILIYSSVFMLFGLGLLFIYADKTLLDEQLFYFLMGKTFCSDIYILFPNGKLKNISPIDQGIFYQASINRMGTEVVFYGNYLGPPRLWLYNIRLDKCTALTPKGVSARHPVFSYDGKQIVFSSDLEIKQQRERIEFMHGDGTPPKNMIFNLFTLDLNTKKIKQITFGNYQDQRPAFSPDSKMVAFVSNRSGENRIWTVTSNGSKPPEPLQKEGDGYRPWFARDGSVVYFFSHINQRHQICFIDVATKKISPLKNDTMGNSHGPFADYDQNTLLIHSNRTGKWTLFELDLKGGPVRSIQPAEFEEALHVTRSINGIMVFDVPDINPVRKMASLGLKMTKAAKNRLMQ